MRVRHFVLLGASSLLLSGIVASGCGGDSASPGSQDAGQDTAVDQSTPPPDTGAVDVADTGVACVDADLTNLNPPDASLADGASSVGLCVACVKSACDAQLQACNDDCSCKDPIAAFFNCVGTGQSLLNCAAPLLGGGVPVAAQALGQCVFLGCRQACAPGAGGDSGAQDAGSEDAASDGG